MSWHRGYVAAGPWGRAQPRRLPHPYHRATPCSTGPRSEGRGSQLTAPGIPGTDCACPVPGTGGPESSRGTTTLGRPAQQHRDPEVAKPPSPESPGSLLLPATPRRRQGPSAWGEGQNTEGLRGAHSRAGNCMVVRTFRAVGPTAHNPRTIPRVTATLWSWA